ncbi:MAG: AzlD domain-containing protein [Desulfobacteraceae bacterium]|jgi:branched-subunit amino acid transport protein|nr:AzlD domain-containing protein [Desulfobacteraceae bacterium]
MMPFWPEYAFMIVGMGIVTYLPRWLPLILLSRRQLPEWLVDWLDFIPVAILSALLAPLLLTSGPVPHLDIGRAELFAALPTFGVAFLTRSLGGTVLAGMLAFWLIQLYWPG